MSRSWTSVFTERSAYVQAAWLLNRIFELLKFNKINFKIKQQLENWEFTKVPPKPKGLKLFLSLSLVLLLGTDSLFQKQQQPSLVEQKADGSLHFSPFSAELYGQDVHSSVYFCEASNTFGTIRSRDVHVKSCKYPAVFVGLWNLHSKFRLNLLQFVVFEKLCSWF